MRYVALSFACLFTANMAQAASCDYQATAVVGNQQVQIHECWDLSKWPADKAKSFCTTALASQDGAQSRVVASCPAPRAAQCTGAKFAAPSANALPPEYFARMPKEIADKIKANMERAGAGLAPYSGLETTVNYYASPGGLPSLADQRQDCEVGKKGKFVPAGG